MYKIYINGKQLNAKTLFYLCQITYEFDDEAQLSMVVSLSLQPHSLTRESQTEKLGSI